MKRNTTPAEPPAVALPTGTPLLAKTERAAEIFGVSAKTLYRMRVHYPDFDKLTIKTGREVLFDVPRCYEWFGRYLGGQIET